MSRDNHVALSVRSSHKALRSQTATTPLEDFTLPTLPLPHCGALHNTTSCGHTGSRVSSTKSDACTSSCHQSGAASCFLILQQPGPAGGSSQHEPTSAEHPAGQRRGGVRREQRLRGLCIECRRRRLEPLLELSLDAGGVAGGEQRLDVHLRRAPPVAQVLVQDRGERRHLPAAMPMSAPTASGCSKATMSRCRPLHVLRTCLAADGQQSPLGVPLERGPGVACVAHKVVGRLCSVQSFLLLSTQARSAAAVKSPPAGRSARAAPSPPTASSPTRGTLRGPPPPRHTRPRPQPCAPCCRRRRLRLLLLLRPLQPDLHRLPGRQRRRHLSCCRHRCACRCHLSGHSRGECWPGLSLLQVAVHRHGCGWWAGQLL